MTVKPNIFQGLLLGLKSNIFTKWGSGLLGRLTGSATASGQITMDYLVDGAVTGSSLISGGDLLSPLSGDLAGAGAATGDFVSLSIDSTIQGILTALDPMQELIDAMGFATKPTYMWGGDQASGDSIEIGGSGYDLVPTSVTLAQTSAVLGAGNFAVLNAAGDSLANTADAALLPGTGSFAVLWVGNLTLASMSGHRPIGDQDAATGWSLFCRNSGADQRFYHDSSSGLSFVSISGTIPVGAGEVLLGMKDATLADMHLHCNAGTVSNTGIYNEAPNPGTQKFAVGDTSTGNGAPQEFGIAAYWKGAAAENLTQTHRDTLSTFLGY